MRKEVSWPLSRTRYIARYLNAQTGTIQDTVSTKPSIVQYDSLSTQDNAQFTYKFSKDTELTGSMRVRLWVSTEESDDMDLFVQLDKLDTGGDTVPFVAFAMFDDGPLGMGWLRASHRELDHALTEINRPWHTHKRKLPLRPGEVVPVDIEIVATSTLFRKGESLKMTVQGTDIFRRKGDAGVMLHEASVNNGKHSLYSGGVHESYVVMPVIDC